MTIHEMEQIQEMIEKSVKSGIQASVPDAVRTTVNGKIDAFRKENKEMMDDMNKKMKDHNIKHEADMQELKPYLQAAAGAKIGFRVFLYIGSLAGAYASLKALFPKYIP